MRARIQVLAATILRRAWPAFVASAFTLSMPASAAVSRVAYVLQNGSGYSGAAYLVTWRDGARAQLVSTEGRNSGTVSVEGSNRIIELAKPLSYSYFSGEVDPCIGTQAELRDDVTHIAFRVRSGTDMSGLSAVSQKGITTTLTGCAAGKVEPFGEITETSGVPTLHRPLDARPSMQDLPPGTAIVGMTPTGILPALQSDVDVVTLEQSAARFERSGARVPMTRRQDGWLVLDLGRTGLYGYTRITRADSSGVEQWLKAEWVDGAIVKVDSAPMFKANGAAAWGTMAGSSRKWQAGLFAKSESLFFIHLYRNGTGERVTRDRATGEEVKSRIDAWRIRNGVLEMDRRFGDGVIMRRYWVPKLRTAKAMAVIESEVRIQPDGTRSVWITRRVNWYIDTGRSG